MRKELIWAAAIGIIFGLIIAFGAWRVSSRKESVSVETSPTPIPSAGELKITLSQPEEGDVVTEDSINVSGLTKALSWVVVSGEKGDYIIQAAENGSFSQEVDLTAGVNWIKAVAFDSRGAKSTEKVLVVYSSSFEERSAPSPTPGTNSTESAIRQKVAEKVAEALDNPKAYIGVVTDIADSTIEIKTLDAKINQIATSFENLTVINQKGTNNKTVKLTDIAIGDFIVAMGYVNTKSVLSAQRILITDPVVEPKIEAVYGKVTDTTTKSLTVSALVNGEEYTVIPSSKTDIEVLDEGEFLLTKFANIDVDDTVIFLTDTPDETTTVRSIFVVGSPQS